MTSSNIAAERKLGMPWCFPKGLDNFLAVSKFLSADLIKDPANLDLDLKINGAIKQKGNTKDLIFGIEEQISYSSKFMTLRPGDLFLTGTPHAPGPVADNDKLVATLRQDRKIIAKIAVDILYKKPPSE